MNGLNEVKKLIADDPRLQTVFDAVTNHSRGTGESFDGSHDLSHLLRVAYWGLRISDGSVPAVEIVAAALLHDLVNTSKNSPDRALASERSAEESRGILTRSGFIADECERICGAIRDHSFSRGATPKDLLGCVLQDADRLEALGAIGIARAFATGQTLGAVFYHFDNPWAEGRELDDSLFTIDHFFRKLLKLPEKMNTENGRLEAEHRVEFMKNFLEQFAVEIGHSQA